MRENISLQSYKLVLTPEFRFKVFIDHFFFLHLKVRCEVRFQARCNLNQNSNRGTTKKNLPEGEDPLVDQMSVPAMVRMPWGLVISIFRSSKFPSQLTQVLCLLQRNSCKFKFKINDHQA